MLDTSTPNKETSRKATSKFWKRLLQGSLILLIPLGFLAWICLFRDTPLEISKETTYITEPLTSDGKRVDYFRALEQKLYPPTMKTDDNGYRQIVRAFGPAVDSSSSDAAVLAKQVYEKLGLDPSIKPTMTYEEPYFFIERYVDTHLNKKGKRAAPPKNFKELMTQFEDMVSEIESATKAQLASEYGDANVEQGGQGMGKENLVPEASLFEIVETQEELSDKICRPWTLEELPMMADWLKQNEPAADLIVKATQKPSFQYPMVRTPEQKESNTGILEATLQNVQRFRSFARILAARANYRIGTGDIDGAIDDIIAIKALGRHIGHQGGLVDMLTGISNEGLARSIGVAESLEHQPTETQLYRLLEAFYGKGPASNLPTQTTLQKTMLAERFIMLNGLQKLVFGEKMESFTPWGEEANNTTANFFRIVGINWNVLFSRLNWYLDDQIRMEQIANKIASTPSYGLSLNLLLPSSRSEIIADYIAEANFGSIPASQETLRRTKCCDNIYQITLAMLLYEKQHGRLPPAYTVDDSGKPLHSWRVLLLPYLGDDAKKLYSKIKLDEPWDSKHNQRFHEAAVEFYQCPSAELAPGQTTYSVVVGETTAFQAGKGKTLDQFGPNSANMILVLESPAPACWMDPMSNLNFVKDSFKIPNYGFGMGMGPGMPGMSDDEEDDEMDLDMGPMPDGGMGMGMSMGPMPELDEKDVCNVLEKKENSHPGVIISGLRSGSTTPIPKELNRENLRQGLEGTNTRWREQ